MSGRIFLLEDDSSLGETLKEQFEAEGKEVVWCPNIQSAKTSLQTQKFDILILDIGLPDGNGFDLAAWVKKEQNQNQKTPIMFLTALNSAHDRLTGYELGADEYIPKPFHWRELKIRVQHVLANHKSVEVLQVGQRTVRWESLEVLLDDAVVDHLNQKEFELLRLLVNKAPAVVSRDEILNTLWGENEYPSTRTVDNTIVRLRQALADEQQSYIVTVRGIGYRFSKFKGEAL